MIVRQTAESCVNTVIHQIHQYLAMVCSGCQVIKVSCWLHLVLGQNNGATEQNVKCPKAFKLHTCTCRIIHVAVSDVQSFVFVFVHTTIHLYFTIGLVEDHNKHQTWVQTFIWCLQKYENKNEVYLQHCCQATCVIYNTVARQLVQSFTILLQLTAIIMIIHD